MRIHITHVNLKKCASHFRDKRLSRCNFTDCLKISFGCSCQACTCFRMFKGNFHIKDCFVLVFYCTCFRIFKGNFHLKGCFLLVFVFYFEFSSVYVLHLVFTMSLFYSAVAYG